MVFYWSQSGEHEIWFWTAATNSSLTQPWQLSPSLIIDLWIKGFATTISTVFNETAPQLFCVSFQNIYEAASLSRISVTFRKEKACHIIFFILPIWFTTPLKSISSCSERGFVSDWRLKRCTNSSVKWAQVRDDHGLLLNKCHC